MKELSAKGAHGNMEYQIMEPVPRLKRFIRYFWSLQSREESVVEMVRTFVDDSTGIIFQRHLDSSRLSRLGEKLPTMFIYGQTTTPTVARLNAPFTSVGVVFHPLAIHEIFGVDAYYLTDKIFPLDVFSGDRLWCERIVSANSPSGKIAMLQQYLLEKLNDREVSLDSEVGEIIRLIQLQRFHNVKDIIEDTKLSERHLERIFLRSVGVSPRHYLQIVRFNHVLRILRMGQISKLSDVAYQFDFCDQSHLNRVIRRYAGMTPRQLMLQRGTELVNLLLEAS